MFRSLFNRNRQKTKVRQNNTPYIEKHAFEISNNIQTNIDYINTMLDHPDDLKLRQLKLGPSEILCAIMYIDGLVDEQSVQQSVFGSIQDTSEKDYPKKAKDLFDYIYWHVIADANVEKCESFDDLSYHLLSGFTIFFIDGLNKVLLIDTLGGEYRAIEEPVTETLIRGPREGFIENIQQNLSIVRRRLKDTNLRFKTFNIGRRSKKSLAVVYIDGIVNPKLLKEVNRRLQTIDIDSVSESGYIEAWIQDSYLSPFPQIINTERPDKVIAAILQGKVAILLDGTPYALIAPSVFVSVLQSPEDYYERWTIGSLLRILRYFGAFVSVILPSLYIALISMQPDMLPTELALSIAGTREGVPFPPVVEAFMMIITMELLQEAGARLPQTIGQTVGIVGGLVIGEAAVQAGIVSPIMVIVVALTAIANFTIPSFSISISFRIIRFGFMIAATMFGLYGIILVYIMINIHLVNLKSFGIPYSTPFAPFFKSDWSDVIIRAPMHIRTKRPEFLSTVDDTAANREGEET